MYSLFFTLSRVYTILQFFFLIFLFTPALAQNNRQSDSIRTLLLENIEVMNRLKLTSKITISPEASSSPASVSLLGRDYIAKQAITSYGDLLRPLAGVAVSNYQLRGVGYGIQMRGYTVSEHARDVLFLIDGVPQNQGSSIQTNGFVDLRMLIPENIRRLEVIRGPFSPYYGDHAFGGVISFETMDRMPSTIMVSGGLHGFARVLATEGFGTDKQSGYVSIEASNNDDYRHNNSQKLLNGFAKYAFPLWKGSASVRAQAYGQDFNTAGYIVRSDVDSGIISKKSFVSSTDGGSTRQQNLVFNYKGNDSANFTSATIYVQHHDFKRIRTNTIGGPQRLDRDNRIWARFDFRHTIITTLGSLPVLYAAGISFRTDDIDNTRDSTAGGQIKKQTQDRTVKFYTPGIYAQMQLLVASRLKFTLGVRYDKFFYNLTTGSTDTEIPGVSLQPNTEGFSPKIGIAYKIANGINVFANFARGFKSPSGYEEILFNPSVSPSKLSSYEIGVGGDDVNGLLHGLISAYLSDQTGEIQEDPLGELTNFGKTRRSGIEAEGRVSFIKSKGLSIFGNYTHVVAKTRNGIPDQIYVTNTPEYIATLGVDYDFGAAKETNNHFVLSIYDQLIGSKNLNTSGTIRSDAYQRLSGKLSYSRLSWANFRVFVEGSFYPGDGALNEVYLFTGGKLRTAPQAPVNLQLGIRVPF